MAYKALYRTYRPKTFDEVSGQDHIVRTIRNALESGKLAHAYLFAGPRGTGKTTMAKLLAKALNCDEGVGHQCNHCKNCIAINEGNHPDVIEIDAASNNGVDDVRDLIDKVKYGTILGRYKVYIIDEVHMMTPSAFNALLKTLEEPPANVVFILATTEPHKVLPTILSRCQRYDFTKLNNKDIEKRLKEVLEQEGIAYNQESVDLIVSLADGGMRDALSILDQVLAYSGNRLVTEDIIKIFALETTEEKINLIKDLAKSDLGSALDRTHRYFDRGTDIKRLTDDLLTILKDTLIYQRTSSTDLLQILNIDQAKDISRLMDENKIMGMIDSLLETTANFKNVSSINSIFEIGILKLCKNHANDKKVEEIIEETEIEEEPYEDPLKDEIVVEKKPVETVPKIEVNEAVSTEIVSEKPKILVNCVDGESYKIDENRLVDIAVLSKTNKLKSQLINDWSKLNSLMTHPELGKTASLLVSAHPLLATDDVLVLEFGLKASAERANLIENQQAIQDVINNTFGKRLFVYSLTRNESLEFQKEYINLQQLSKLPKPKDINLEFEGE
ncbi:MAG: DNA polymerase III subunit gamma/tau [Coprobacillus sp.]|nr:DNA polymerase III subunit gamma/tau [Coprobacillus sp.]